MLVHPTADETERKSYSLRGYGDDSNACLIEYQFHIPTKVSSYEDFEGNIRFSETAFKEQVEMSTYDSGTV